MTIRMMKIAAVAMAAAFAACGVTEAEIKEVGGDAMVERIAGMGVQEWTEWLMVARQSNDIVLKQEVLHASGTALTRMDKDAGEKMETAKRLMNAVPGLVVVHIYYKGVNTTTWGFFFMDGKSPGTVYDIKTEIITKGIGNIGAISKGASKD